MRKFAALAVFVMSASSVLVPAPVYAQTVASVPPRQAEAFIADLADRAFAVLRDTSLNQTAREDKFRSLLRAGFDLDRISAAVLGRNRRTATPQQLNDFRAAFPDYVVRIYASRLTDYVDTMVKVAGTSPVGSRGDLLVHSVITGRSLSEPLHVDWRVTQTQAGGPKIIDLSIEGISMATTQRDEFDTKIAQKGFDALIAEVKSDDSRIAIKNPLKKK